MAISTITTANDFVNAYFIQPAILAAASELAQVSPLCRQFNIVDKPATGVQIAVAASVWGTPDDTGTSVDTEFNAAEATDLSSTTFSTNGVTATAAEYGVRMDISDTLLEDAVDAMVLWDTVESTMVGALMLAIDDDICALFASLSTSVGTTTADLTVAQLLSAFTGIRTRGNRAPDGLVAVLSNTQCDDIEAALVSTNAAAAVYAGAADRFLAAAPGPNNGLTNGHVMYFRGNPVYGQGLCDTANAGEDEVGAVFVPSTAANDPFATFGMVMKRLPRLETQRDASARATELVLTLRAAPFELRDLSGCKVVTDA